MEADNQYEVFDFECECGNTESYYLDSSTYELKMIECKECNANVVF